MKTVFESELVNQN